MSTILVRSGPKTVHGGVYFMFESRYRGHGCVSRKPFPIHRRTRTTYPKIVTKIDGHRERRTGQTKIKARILDAAATVVRYSDAGVYRTDGNVKTDGRSGGGVSIAGSACGGNTGRTCVARIRRDGVNCVKNNEKKIIIIITIGS